MNILLSQHISQFDFYALLSSFLFRDRVVVFASHLWRLVSYWLCLPRAEMTGMCYYVHLSFLYLITCQLVFKIKYTTFKKVFLLKTEMMLIVFKNNVKRKFHFSSIYFYFQNCFAGFFCHVYSPGWFPNWIFSCFLKWGSAAAQHRSTDLNSPGHWTELPSVPPLQSLCSFCTPGYLSLHETQFDSPPLHVIHISYQFLIYSYVFSDY